MKQILKRLKRKMKNIQVWLNVKEIILLKTLRKVISMVMFQIFFMIGPKIYLFHIYHNNQVPCILKLDIKCIYLVRTRTLYRHPLYRQDTLPTPTLPTRHFTDRTLYRQDTLPTGHFTNKTLYQQDTLPARHFTDKTLYRQDTLPTIK